MYDVLFSKKAGKEIQQSWNWYEDRQKGLGDRFVSELFEKITSIIRRMCCASPLALQQPIYLL